MKHSVLAWLVILGVLLIDQWVKIWVKLNMAMGEEIEVFSWFRIYFTENPGMAFGMELGGAYGKLFLSVFRIIAVGFIGVYLYKLVQQQTNKGLLVAFSLILAGALGNIIDSVCYGLLFSESGFHSPATFMPAEGGYAGFLYGRVVDMLYFPLVDTHYPEWFPFWGGQKLQFFQPIFNIADTAISVGVGMVIVFYRRFFTDEEEAKTDPAQANPTPAASSEPTA
jgi:signal peptidase II